MVSSHLTSVLVVGLGSIGQRHARLLGERPEIELLLCDAIAEHGAQTQAVIPRPVRFFGDYTQALAARPALVIICTPNHLHVPMALAAIAQGADVLVEKPIAETVPEAESLIEAARRAGTRLHVGYMLRFDVGLQTLKRLVDDGVVGHLCSGRALVGTYVTLLNSRGNEKEGQPYSLVLDYTHEIDFIRWFFGEPRQVQATGAWLTSREKRPQPNVFQMLLRMQSGALVQVHLDYIQFPQRRSFEISGDRGTLTYDFMTGEIRRFGFEREHRWESFDVPPGDTEPA